MANQSGRGEMVLVEKLHNIVGEGRIREFCRCCCMTTRITVVPQIDSQQPTGLLQTLPETVRDGSKVAFVAEETVEKNGG